jgi:filamentous hemagglutinin
MVGSLGGDTTLVAKDGALHIQGSAVSSPEGNVTLLGQSVNIEEAYNTSTYQEKNSFKQSGVTLSASAPVVDAALAARSSVRTMGDSKDSRVNAMAAANTAYDAYQAGSAVAGGMQGGGQSVSISLTYGEQQSESETNATSREVVGSSINGKNVAVVATGAGDASTLRISGSDVYGADSTTLYADGNIDVLAAQNTYEQHSENSSSGWNAGVAASYGSDGGSLGITAGGNVGKGSSDGKTVTHTHAHVGSGGTTSVTSGGTLTLKGGQISGEQVAVDVKHLVIESLQDTQTYDSKQMNASAQVTVGYGVSASGSYNQSKINNDYASVNEQSGILAGDGGYSVKVKEKTDLKGGIITSTDAAEAAGKNSFSTGTLTTSDIENHADYEGSSFGLSGSAGVNGSGEQGKYQMAQGSSDGKAGGAEVNKSVGFGLDDDHQSSTTHSGINTKNITITDAAGQAATGKSMDQIKAEVATLTSTDTVTENSGALVNRFDAAQVQKELDVQTQVTQTFDQNRQEAKAELAANERAQRDEARDIRAANGGKDTEESKKLDEEAKSLHLYAQVLDVAAIGVYVAPGATAAVISTTATQVDLVHRAATSDKIVLQKCEAAGQNCTQQQVDLNDVKVVDGKIYVFNNGIFNDEEKALANGAKQNDDTANKQGVYYILNPETGSPIAEILYAGYDKLNDLLGGALPLTQASETNQKMILRAQELGGVVDSTNHSRGSMTWINALGDLKNQSKDKTDAAIGDVYFFGAAANAQESADLGYVLSGGLSKQYQATHPTDLVGRLPGILGGNPATGEKNEGSFPSSHSAYTKQTPPDGTFIGGVNMRELTDNTWGVGNYSVPVYVPPSGKAKAELEKRGGQ